jgi:hypothetical protein
MSSKLVAHSRTPRQQTTAGSYLTRRQLNNCRDVRFAAKADIDHDGGNVRFVPKADISPDYRERACCAVGALSRLDAP